MGRTTTYYLALINLQFDQMEKKPPACMELLCTCILYIVKEAQLVIRPTPPTFYFRGQSACLDSLSVLYVIPVLPFISHAGTNKTAYPLGD